MVTEQDRIIMANMLLEFVQRILKGEFDSGSVDANFNYKEDYSHGSDIPILMPGDEVVTITLGMTKARKDAIVEAKHEMMRKADRDWKALLAEHFEEKNLTEGEIYMTTFPEDTPMEVKLVDLEETKPVDKGSLAFYHKGLPPERRLEPLPDFENPDLTETEQEFKERFDSGFPTAPANIQLPVHQALLKPIPNPEDVIE